MSELPIMGPWPKGIHNRQPEHAMPEGTLRKAENVDIDNLGFVSRRQGFTKASSALHIPAVPVSRHAFTFGSRRFVVFNTTPNVLRFSPAFEDEILTGIETEPGAYNQIEMGGNIQVCLPLATGIWVATDTETWWHEGKDPSAMQPTLRLPYGAIYNSGKILTAPDSANNRGIWASVNGVVIGDSGGNAKNLTYENLSPRAATEASAQVVIRNGKAQYIVRLS